MRHEKREMLKQIAERVATQLHADLKNGKISKIDIGVIRVALLAEPDQLDHIEFELVEDLTTRRVVEKAA